MMGPVVEEISNEVNDAKVCKINIDEQMSIAQKYGVMSIPTFIVFKNGDVADKKWAQCRKVPCCLCLVSKRSGSGWIRDPFEIRK